MGGIGLVLLLIIMWIVNRSDKKYQKRMLKNFNDYKAGNIDVHEYVKRDLDLLMKKYHLE